MPFVKGQKKVGGRKKGTTNAKLKAVEEIIAKLDCNPIEGLCMIANADWKALGYENECYFMEKPDGAVKMGYTITPDMRLTAYKELAKYVYPQKKAVELSAGEDTQIKVEVIEYRSKK